MIFGGDDDNYAGAGLSPWSPKDTSPERQRYAQKKLKFAEVLSEAESLAFSASKTVHRMLRCPDDSNFFFHISERFHFYRTTIDVANAEFEVGDLLELDEICSLGFPYRPDRVVYRV